jgi:dTDP-4-amino-4,6-dideoxygalactose transaminase
MLHRSPHPTLEFAHLVPAASEKRLSSLSRASEIHYFFNARAALFHVFQALRRGGRQRVLLPAFHCVSVVEPALRAGMDVSFYRIDRHLDIDVDELMAASTGDVAAVVFINYFGMPARFEPMLDELHARGIAAIEDCSHSFMQANPPALAGGRADLSVYSFWKLVPSGVGGGLLSATPFSEPALTTRQYIPEKTSIWQGKFWEMAER